MRTTFCTVLIEKATHDNTVFLLTPDLGYSVFEPFIKEFPNRFLNTGIAEQNTISVAAGLALSGYKPYVYSISPFALMRCFEQIRIDVAYMDTNVKIIGSGGGFAYGPAGATHHAIEDFAVAKSLPNMTVCSPGDPIEARYIFTQSFSYPHPMYIRIAKNNEPTYHNFNDTITIGKAFELSTGTDLQIIATGTITAQLRGWISEYKQKGISAGLTVFPTIKPLDTGYLDTLKNRNTALYIVEEHSVIGGLGESIASYLAQQGAKNKIKLVGIPDQYSHYVGDQNFILNKFGLLQPPEFD